MSRHALVQQRRCRRPNVRQHTQPQYVSMSPVLLLLLALLCSPVFLKQHEIVNTERTLLTSLLNK